MKRNVKPVLVLLMAVGLLLSLCGCSGLENMRNKQAFPGEKGEVLWKGTVYKALPSNENFYAACRAALPVVIFSFQFSPLCNLFVVLEQGVLNQFLR